MPSLINSGDKDIPVQVSTIRPVLSTQSVHQNPETSNRAPEVNRHSSGNLHGRHAHHGTLHPVAQRAYLPNVVSVGESGFHHNPNLTKG